MSAGQAGPVVHLRIPRSSGSALEVTSMGDGDGMAIEIAEVAFGRAGLTLDADEARKVAHAIAKALGAAP